MKDYILFKNLDGKYLTLKDCMKRMKQKKRTQTEEKRRYSRKLKQRQ